LITILEKNEKTKWYMGECNGKTGAFPADKVKLIISRAEVSYRFLHLFSSQIISSFMVEQSEKKNVTYVAEERKYFLRECENMRLCMRTVAQCTAAL
jgi:hypothetical protein